MVRGRSRARRQLLQGLSEENREDGLGHRWPHRVNMFLVCHFKFSINCFSLYVLSFGLAQTLKIVRIYLPDPVCYNFKVQKRRFYILTSLITLTIAFYRVTTLKVTPVLRQLRRYN